MINTIPNFEESIEKLGRTPVYDDVIGVIAKNIADMDLSIQLRMKLLLPKKVRDDLDFQNINSEDFKPITEKFKNSDLDEKHLILLLNAFKTENPDAFKKLSGKGEKVILNIIWDIVQNNRKEFQLLVWDWLPKQILLKAKEYSDFLIKELAVKKKKNGGRLYESPFSLVEIESLWFSATPSYQHYTRFVDAQIAFIEILEKANRTGSVDKNPELWKKVLFAESWNSYETMFLKRENDLSNAIELVANHLPPAFELKAKVNSEYYSMLFKEWIELVREFDGSLENASAIASKTMELRRFYVESVELLNFRAEKIGRGRNLFEVTMEQNLTKPTDNVNTGIDPNVPTPNPPANNSVAPNMNDLIDKHLGDQFVDIFDSTDIRNLFSFAVQFSTLDVKVQKEIWDLLPVKESFDSAKNAILLLKTTQPKLSALLLKRMDSLPESVNIIDLAYWLFVHISLSNLDSIQSNDEIVEMYTRMLSNGKDWTKFKDYLEMKIPLTGPERAEIKLNFDLLQKAEMDLEEMANNSKATKDEINKKAEEIAEKVAMMEGVDDLKGSATDSVNIANQTISNAEIKNKLVIGGFVVLSATAVGAYFNGFFGQRERESAIAES